MNLRKSDFVAKTSISVQSANMQLKTAGLRSVLRTQQANHEYSLLFV